MYTVVFTVMTPCILEAGTSVSAEYTSFIFRVVVRKVWKVEYYIEVGGKEIKLPMI
jgi:hypothetical protein